MKNLKWRLSKLPTPDELRELVRDKIITQEEAREILFSEETEKEVDEESLKSEIKFLRELIENLSKNNRTIVYEYIKTYPTTPWIAPYVTWCSSLGNGSTQTYGSSGITNAVYTSTSGGTHLVNTAYNFTDIQTF